MNAAWKKLTKRDEFNKAVLGWIRTTEVTRGRDRTAHPHFHVLMMVRPSYFTKLYVKHERWTELWKECAQFDYTPIVDVRVVKDRRRNGEPLHGAVAETLKYAVKPEDLMDRDWLLELTRQVYKMRFIVVTTGAPPKPSGLRWRQSFVAPPKLPVATVALPCAGSLFLVLIIEG
jgi:plasmid rolling circle replication initiator protein Rep